jgi:hypothetical protein
MDDGAPQSNSLSLSTAISGCPLLSKPSGSVEHLTFVKNLRLEATYCPKKEIRHVSVPSRELRRSMATVASLSDHKSESAGAILPFKERHT